MTRNLINLVGFYVGWFLCVYWHDWTGPLLVAWLIVPTVYFSRARARDLRAVGLAAAFGTVADTVLEQAGLWTYAGGPRVGPLCPLWIVALWALFGSTLNASLGFLAARPWAAAAFGAVGGPLSYWAAQRIGGVTLHPGALPAVGLEYALATPALLSLVHGRRAEEALA